MERLELRSGGVIRHCRAAAVKALRPTPVVAGADVTVDVACERVVLARCRAAAAVVMSCRAGMHAGGPCAFAEVALPRRRPTFLSAAASIVSKHLTRKHEQALNARGDAVTVLTFDGMLSDVLKGVSHSVGPDGLQLGGDELRYLDPYDTADRTTVLTRRRRAGHHGPMREGCPPLCGIGYAVHVCVVSRLPVQFQGRSRWRGADQTRQSWGRPCGGVWGQPRWGWWTHRIHGRGRYSVGRGEHVARPCEHGPH